jgi:hypothetical protein
MDSSHAVSRDEVGKSSERSAFAPNAGRVFWWVCTKNPFYAISAALVLLGLWISFGNQTEQLETWLLMGGLAGHTLLLAVTALVLVRFLNLWDDARTVMLLVVLMFLATSVTFDCLLMEDQQRGAAFNLLGLGLSILVTETLLRRIKLRLPALYRLPYYFVLMLFFLYPIFVRSLLIPGRPESQEPLMWGLFGFSTAAGLVFLTLLPVLRRGAGYMRGNGSPWPWPLYPWSLFVVLAIAVPGRAVLMCWSLHPLDTNQLDRLIFGPYFLIPFGFALTVLFLELGLILARKGMIRFGLAAPLLLMGMALLGHNPADPIYRLLRVMTVSSGRFEAFDNVSREPDPVYNEFLEIFSNRLGVDPLFATLVLSCCFYAYAAARRVPLALECLAGSLASMVIIGPNTLSDGLLSSPELAQPAPLLAAAGILLFVGARQRNPWNLLRGAACLAGFIALAVPLPAEQPIPGLRSAIFVHLTLLAMLGLGAAFTDTNGISLRRIGSAFILVLSLAGMHQWFVQEEMPAALPIVYPLCMGILLAVYGHFLRDSWILAMATIVLGYWVFKFGWILCRSLRGLIRGFDYLLSGLAFFMIAVLVSLGKSGMLSRWIESRWLPAWLCRFLPPTPALAPSPAIELSSDGNLTLPVPPDAPTPVDEA